MNPTSIHRLPANLIDSAQWKNVPHFMPELKTLELDTFLPDLLIWTSTVDTFKLSLIRFFHLLDILMLFRLMRALSLSARQILTFLIGYSGFSKRPMIG